MKKDYDAFYYALQARKIALRFSTSWSIAPTPPRRIAVFNHGRVEQVGSPAEVYERPATAFVAGFIGVSNVLDGEVAARITGSPQAFTVRPDPCR